MVNSSLVNLGKITTAAQVFIATSVYLHYKNCHDLVSYQCYYLRCRLSPLWMRSSIMY